MLLVWIAGFALLGSIGALAGAAALLSLRHATRTALVPYLVSYAAGTLLAAAFLGMIPTALADAPPSRIGATILAGIVFFFALEKFVLWRHCHDEECVTHSGAGPLILLGDAFHNFVDGVVIAAAFLSAIPLGVATATAVIAHEVPQEIGDFAILLDHGYGRMRAFALNGLSSATTLPGALAAYFWLSELDAAVPYILAISASSFIYIASADLIPGLHRKVTLRSSVVQLMLLLAGIGTIALLRLIQ